MILTAMQYYGTALEINLKYGALIEIADGGGHGLEKLGVAESRETKHGAL